MLKFYRPQRAIIAGLAAIVLLAGCQSTASQTSDDDGPADAYPDMDSPGLTETSITIGLPGVTNSKSKYWTSFGPASLALEALVEQYNVDGGIAGRIITPIWESDALTGAESTTEDVVKHLCDLSVGEKSSFARQGASWTGEELANLGLAGCVGPTRTINLIPHKIVNADLLEKNPDVVAPNALDDVTAAHVLVDRLTKQGFFDESQRVAVVSPGPNFVETAETVLAPALEMAGIEDPLVLVGTGADPDTDAEVAANSVVLKLKTANVDRILYFDDWRRSYFLVNAMIAQKYTPPIGTLSSAKPDQMVFYGYPADQLFAVSWLGGFVLGEDTASTLATLPDSAASQECVALSEATGVKIEFGTEELLLDGCNMLSLIDAAFQASGADEPSSSAFFSGLAKLTDFDSAYGVTLDFSHGRTGAAQVWDMKGDAACNCLNVIGGPYPIEYN